MEQYEDDQHTRRRVLTNAQVLGFIGRYWLRRRWLLGHPRQAKRHGEADPLRAPSLVTSRRVPQRTRHPQEPPRLRALHAVDAGVNILRLRQTPTKRKLGCRAVEQLRAGGRASEADVQLERELEFIAL